MQQLNIESKKASFPRSHADLTGERGKEISQGGALLGQPAGFFELLLHRGLYYLYGKSYIFFVLSPDLKHILWLDQRSAAFFGYDDCFKALGGPTNFDLMTKAQFNFGLKTGEAFQLSSSFEYQEFLAQKITLLSGTEAVLVVLRHKNNHSFCADAAPYQGVMQGLELKDFELAILKGGEILQQKAGFRQEFCAKLPKQVKYGSPAPLRKDRIEWGGQLYYRLCFLLSELHDHYLLLLTKNKFYAEKLGLLTPKNAFDFRAPNGSGKEARSAKMSFKDAYRPDVDNYLEGFGLAGYSSYPRASSLAGDNFVEFADNLEFLCSPRPRSGLRYGFNLLNNSPDHSFWQNSYDKFYNKGQACAKEDLLAYFLWDKGLFWHLDSQEDLVKQLFYPLKAQGTPKIAPKANIFPGEDQRHKSLLTSFAYLYEALPQPCEQEKLAQNSSREQSIASAPLAAPLAANNNELTTAPTGACADNEQEHDDSRMILLQLMAQLEKLAEEKGIIMHYSLASELYPIALPAQKLRQIFYSLVANAINYSFLGSQVFIHAYNEQSYRNGQNFCQLMLQIHDKGPGLTEETLEKLETMTEAELSAQDKNLKEALLKIPLYTVKYYVEEAGGEFILSSAPMQGTQYIIALPYKS